MRNRLLVVGAAALASFLPIGTTALSAQAVTGRCKDGTTTTSVTKSGACRGHKGVAEWTASAAAPAASPAPATAPKAESKAKAPRAMAVATETFPCKDGTAYSGSSKRGACRGHGGVAKAAAPAPAAATVAPAPAPTPATPPAAKREKPSAPAPAAAPAPSTTDAAAPAGATARCKDGSYSKSTHRAGTCARHGGVDSWLKQP
jgi:Protein of unknown function (DUF3761)